MPPVIRPVAARSSQRLTPLGPGGRQAGRPLPPPRVRPLLPLGLGDDRWRRRPRRRPDHLELALLPLADRPREGDVLAVLEADLADDGVELAGGDRLTERFPVEAHLLHRLLEDLKPGPGVRARPAIGLLMEP